MPPVCWFPFVKKLAKKKGNKLLPSSSDLPSDQTPIALEICDYPVQLFMFEAIQDELLFLIIEKMNPKALPNLVSTSKWLYEFVEINRKHLKIPVEWTDLGLLNDDFSYKHIEKFKENGEKKFYTMINDKKCWKKSLLDLGDKELVGVRINGLFRLERTTFEQVPRIISIFSSIKCAGFYFEKVQQHIIEAILKKTRPFSIEINNRDVGYFLNKLELLIYDESLTKISAFRTAKQIKLHNFDKIDYDFLNNRQELVEMSMTKQEFNRFLRILSNKNVALPSKIVINLFRGEGHCDIFQEIPLILEWSLYKCQSLFQNSKLADFSIDSINEEDQHKYYCNLYSLPLADGGLLALADSMGQTFHMKVYQNHEMMQFDFEKFGFVLE